ncbi:hypothetical protein [Peptostreptococcus sp.]|uniref:hypothetical protein n=1 Tax=Peptostreptococcus sp. TaxID=1262 RepID=UPI00399276FD
MYYSDAGQTQYEKNRKNSKKKFKVLECIDFIKFVEKSFKEQYWSLDECYGRAKSEKIFKNMVCTNTLYKYVELGILNIKNTDLPQRLKRLQKSTRKIDLEKIIEVRMQIEELHRALNTLTKEERKLMEAIFYKEESLRSIGKKEKVNYQAISKMRDNILEKLIEILKDKI